MDTCGSMKATLKPDKLKERILAHGYSFADVATKAGISRVTITHGMKGRPVNSKTVKKIADALGVPTLEIAEVR